MIKLTEEYYVRGDAHCYILSKRSTNKDGIIYLPMLYYTRLEDCIDGVLRMKTREFLNKETIQDLKDVKKYLTELEKTIKNNLGTLGDKL